MTNIAPKETVTLIIGKAEALILFELLFDFYRQPALEIKDDAQRLALVRVHGALESTLVEPFTHDYGEIIVPRGGHKLTKKSSKIVPLGAPFSSSLFSTTSVDTL